MSYESATIIIREECARMYVPIYILRSGKKTRTTAKCRRLIVERLQKETSLSGAEIASMVGLRSAPRRAREGAQEGGL